LPNRYDVIFCTEVLEHLEKPHVALANLVAALNPGGILVLTVPDGRQDTINEHLNFWSPEGWRAFLIRECPQAELATRKLLNGPYNFALLRFP
jgi:2-polyprenyl-3-methyl-5-hydroxy-6-metoxy-1,4-benzoquinol methylase